MARTPQILSKEKEAGLVFFARGCCPGCPIVIGLGLFVGQAKLLYPFDVANEELLRVSATPQSGEEVLLAVALFELCSNGCD